MTAKHLQILADLDLKGAQHRCLYTGKNIVGRVSAMLDGKRLSVCITKTQFKYIAAVSYDGSVWSQMGNTPSEAVLALGRRLRGN